MLQTVAFDAAQEHVFQFTYSGDQAYKNRLIIRDNESNAVVYDQTIATFQLKHALPAGRLTNSLCYNAQIQVLTKGGAVSAPSRKIIFYCYTTPSFQFANVAPNQIIHNSSYALQLLYAQNEGELLDSFQVYLYNSAHTEIHASGVVYQTADLSYTIRGLQDNYQYYVRAVGRTVHGMEIDTGHVPFGTEYIEPSVFTALNLENLKFDGSILIQSNIISILGTSNPSPPVYVDDKMVDLSGPSHWVKFEQGFNIQGDFTLQLIGQGFNDNSEILVMDNRQNSIVVRYMRGTFQDEAAAYFTLEAHNSITAYFITSNYILVPTPTEKICLWIRRAGDFYDLKAAGAGYGNCFERAGLTDYRGVLLESTLLLKDSILYA